MQDPTDRTIQFVVQQGGRIRVLRNGALLAQDFLDLTSVVASGGENGLLGLAFQPDYAFSGRFFVNFTNISGNTVVARFKRSTTSTLIADPATRFDLRWNGAGPAFISQPYEGHKGGNLQFSPDGFLYIGLGDGGGTNDPDHRAQDPGQLLGKMLRIAVLNIPESHPVGYEVFNNPFEGVSNVRREIWAFGLRNPWRYSFDDPALGGTGALVIGDAGQGSFQEINCEPARRGGRNYGWRNRDGAHDNVFTLPPTYLPMTDPIYDYARGPGSSLTGGYVYRGIKLGTPFRGRYFFADSGLGRVWSMGLTLGPTTGDARAADIIDHSAELGGSPTSSFGVDADGELYMVDYTGRILAIDAVPAAPVVTLNPAPVTVRVGRIASFSAGASGTPVPSVQWQVSVDGGATFTNVPSATSTTYTFRLAASDRGKLFRAMFTTSAGTAATAPASTSVRAAPLDFDGDGITDLTVWRPGDGFWHTLTSGSSWGTAAARATEWGIGTEGDVPLSGDIDGDGLADLVVWRAPIGTWFWLTSSSGYSYEAAGSIQWGNQGLGDVPFLGDIDGDGKIDLVLWRASTGTWFWLTSGTDYAYSSAGSKQWGSQSQRDVPMLADFDGDGRADLTVWRPGSGTWFWLTAASGYSYASAVSIQWGNQAAGDVPLTSDMDDDNRADPVVWRASTGEWFWLTSTSEYAYVAALARTWGNQSLGDVPLIGNFDGGVTGADVAVWRASTGTWFWLAGYGMGGRQWGNQAMGDIPIVK